MKTKPKYFKLLLFFLLFLSHLISFTEFTEKSEAVYDVSSLMHYLAGSSIEWPEGGGIESK